mgnify:CR=1 FL=1|tara:strand:- start:485 stop:784 length:300 start_codon:yes stop_codon:yes gene_type:complete
MNTRTDFDILGDNAISMLADESQRIEPHWSDDPRFDSEDHYNRVKSGLEGLGAPDATAADLRKDAEFRSMKQETGNGLYGPQSTDNIWRDGRHGQGYEL